MVEVHEQEKRDDVPDVVRNGVDYGVAEDVKFLVLVEHVTSEVCDCSQHVAEQEEQVSSLDSDDVFLQVLVKVP